MDEDKRSKLIEKRRLAQVRRERQERSARFRSVGRLLCESGVRFSKLVPERCREALGSLASGPGQDERLLWAPIPNGICERWGSKAERDDLLRRALARCAAKAETKVAVVWHPFEAGLRLSAGDLALHAGPILDAGDGGTIWIVAADGGSWLIETAYWDRELCWTPNMPLFTS
ncbi:MAG TPA: hypothetical protein VGB59_09435 [Allosphingosinicella sp.]|jgi:hypothetical protein